MATTRDFLEGQPHYPSSSCFGAMVYNRDSEQMFVQFGSGHAGIYSRVTEDLAERWHRSGSKGKFYHRNVKGILPYSPE